MIPKSGTRFLEKIMPKQSWLALACLLSLAAGGALAQQTPIAVEAINASKPTRCAETDNVYVKLRSPDVRTFRVEATHPHYLRDLKADTVAPDFGRCDMSRDPVFRATPRQVVLHDAGNWRLLGFTYERFWRPAEVPVHVGDKEETGLHLLQLWTRGRKRDEEVLVLYPADGYWRARVLAPEKLGWQVNPSLPTAYGSSFLVGPIEEQAQTPVERRPFVAIERVHFYPDLGIFLVTFARGGRAIVRVWSLTEERTTLEVALSDAIPSQPFAALRSMYVAEDNADVARVTWRTLDGRRGDVPVMRFMRAQARELWAGRSKPSRHNTSAPDMVFGTFRKFK
jgi:hypothetical protein